MSQPVALPDRDVHGLSALFEPASVAVIGASDDPGRIGGRPLSYLIRSDFAGPVYPINPNRTTVQGLKAYADISLTPGPVDLAIVALPAANVLDALEACAAKGVKSAVVFSSGFAEVGEVGADQQQRLTAIARKSGMRVLGPNCLGVFNSGHRFYATFSAALQAQLPAPGPLAIASQSGACGGHLAYLCGQRGIGIRYWVTTGNEAEIDLSEVLLWLAQSPNVKVIAAYAEAIRDGDTFVRALETARANGKPIVMLKVGRTQTGARAAASHTGALAGEDAVYDAILQQYGVWRASSIEEMLDIAYACGAGLFPATRRIGLVSASGGVGVQMADTSEELGLDVAPMPEPTQQALKALIPFIGSANPVDVTAQVMNDMSLFERCLDLTLAEGGYDSVIVFLSSGPAMPRVRDALLDFMRPLRARYPDRLIVLSMAAPRDTVRAFEEAGFLVFEDTDRALTAIAALARFAEHFARATAPGTKTAPVPDNLPAAMNEHAAKQVMKDAGIPVWPETFVPDVSGVRAAAAAYEGSVAIKIASADILHKTEVGGVALGLSTPEAAEVAAREMAARISSARPDAKLDGFLISPMCVGGVETICGSFRDPVFGPMVMFGLGGILVEALKDVAFRRAPFDEAEAMRMIDSVRGRAILDGLRGRPAADVAALARVLADLSRFADAHRDHVAEIDINPLSARADGAFALDALITRVPSQGGLR